MSDTYDSTDPQSIYDYADKLMFKTLREATGVTDEEVSKFKGKHKGDLGVLVEKFLYCIEPKNEHEPDFSEAGVELKATGLKALKNNTLVPKERLVLSMVSYHTVVKESFDTSYLYAKIRLILLLFYFYVPNTSVIDRRFIAKLLWTIPEEDMALIIADWEKIVAKVKAGEAHELSEGDTLYLGACTKAKDSSVRTTQPYSDTPAKPRAFSFKPSYMKLVYNQIQHGEQYEEFLKSPQQKPFEELVIESLRQYEGQRVDDLFAKFGPEINQNSKNKYALLTNRLLGIKSKKISEFEKAEIIIKTLRLRKNRNPKEDISFPAFNYFQIINQEWDESDFKDIVESKFFFVLLQETKEGLIFNGAKFWNMPYVDRIEAERVFNETVNRIKDNKADNLPSKKFSKVSHVRPHGRNKKDTLPAPGGIEVVKQCFWLNSPYIGSQIKNLR